MNYLASFHFSIIFKNTVRTFIIILISSNKRPAFLGKKIYIDNMIQQTTHKLTFNKYFVNLTFSFSLRDD